MSPPLYGFGLSQEDERTERAGLALREGDRVFAITSGGEMPLGLLAAGAAEVTAVEIAPAQTRLARLKLVAALALPQPDAAGVIGYTRCADRRRHWATVRQGLPADDVAFWEAHPDAIDGGVIWAGRFERYVARLVCLLRPVMGRALRGLFDQPDLATQAAWFDDHIGTPLLRTVLRVAFSPRVYRGRGVDRASLAHRTASDDLGARFFQHLRAVCTRTPARDNPLLQLVLLGEVLDPGLVPDWLRPEGLARLRTHADQLRFVDADATAWLEQAPVGSFDAFQLSNLADWLDEDAWARLLRAVVRAAAPGARVVWRCMHADRPVPADLLDRLIPDRALGERLRETDRFPFYTIVPATVR